MLFLNACENSNFLSTILLLKEILEVISILVPIILIVMLSIQLGKIIFGDEKIIPGVLKSVVTKVVAAVLVFFVPTFVNLLLTNLNQAGFSTTDCWLNANNSSIAEFKAVEEAKKIADKEARGRESQEAKDERELLEKLREEARKENEKEANKNGKVNGVIYYNQCEDPWRTMKYGNNYGTICSHGCGPTSSAVIASTFLGETGHTPKDAEAWICSHGGCTTSGTVAGTNASYLKSLGLNVTGPHYWNEYDMLVEKLATGDYLALILVHNNTGRAIFTSGGHYFVLTGIEDGEFTIAQVSRRKQNDQTWPKTAFNGDVANFYMVSKN
ncbi:MAG: C39 family peptidase [Bacilli bacterium]|nr:C39 family peptidase [Bacilli bacterium]